MRQLFKDPEIDTKYYADCKASWAAYVAARSEALRIYFKACDDAYDAAVAAEKVKERNNAEG